MSLQLLSETNILEQIKTLLFNANDACFAVAYWGKGSFSKLKLNKLKNAKIICDLDSGSCDISAIEKMLKKGFEVRTNPRLHSKLYLTNNGVILGSANASDNGLWFYKKSKQHELSIYSDDKKIVKQSKEWFEKIWNISTEVTSDDLAIYAILKSAKKQLKLDFDLKKLEELRGIINVNIYQYLEHDLEHKTDPSIEFQKYCEDNNLDEDKFSHYDNFYDENITKKGKYTIDLICDEDGTEMNFYRFYDKVEIAEGQYTCILEVVNSIGGLINSSHKTAIKKIAKEWLKEIGEKKNIEEDFDEVLDLVDFFNKDFEKAEMIT